MTNALATPPRNPAPTGRTQRLLHSPEIAQRTDFSDAYIAWGAYDALDAYERLLLAYIDRHAARLARGVLRLRVNAAELARFTECSPHQVRRFLDDTARRSVARDATAKTVGMGLLITIVLSAAPDAGRGAPA